MNESLAILNGGGFFFAGQELGPWGFFNMPG